MNVIHSSAWVGGILFAIITDPSEVREKRRAAGRGEYGEFASYTPTPAPA
jgi:hypothetical protein